jgi:hypothetical protein
LVGFRTWKEVDSGRGRRWIPDVEGDGFRKRKKWIQEMEGADLGSKGGGFKKSRKMNPDSQLKGDGFTHWKGIDSGSGRRWVERGRIHATERDQVCHKSSCVGHFIATGHSQCTQ